MTDQKEVILKAIIYEIVIATGDEGTKALLTADNLLADMAVPVTQYDFTYADRAKMKKLFRAVERFLKSSKMKVNSYTKAGLQAKFETLWVPTLSEKEKQDLIADFRIIDGFDEEGYAIFNEKTFNTWKDVFSKELSMQAIALNVCYNAICKLAVVRDTRCNRWKRCSESRPMPLLVVSLL